MNRLSRVFCGFALVCAGCGDDEAIRVLRVAKPASISLRTIAVVIPRSDATWFLKLSGLADAVAHEESPFRQFAHSVTFPQGGPPIQYSTPAEWKAQSPGPQRFAMWRTANGLEVSVTRLEASAGTLLDNVNRWRRQINLPPIREDELPSVTSAIDVGGAPATWVDLKLPGGGG